MRALWLAMIVAIGIAGWGFSSVSMGEELDGARGAAFAFAQKVIPPTLKNPSSADFDWQSVAERLNKRLALAPNAEPVQVVAVQGIVRATNSFNAVVPQKYMVWMTQGDETWQAILVMLGDDIVYSTDAGNELLRLVREEQNANFKKNMEALGERTKEKNRKEREARDRAIEETEKKVKKAARLKEAHSAGKAAFAEAARKKRWNVRTVARVNVLKAASRAAEESEFSEDEEELEQFVQGFMANVPGP